MEVFSLKNLIIFLLVIIIKSVHISNAEITDLIQKQDILPSFNKLNGKFPKIDTRKWWCPKPYESECEDALIGLEVCEYDALRSLKRGKIIVSQLCCEVVEEVDEKCLFKIFFRHIHLLPYFKKYCTHVKSSPSPPPQETPKSPPHTPLPPVEQPPTPLKPITPSPLTPIGPSPTTLSPSQETPQPTMSPPSPGSPIEPPSTTPSPEQGSPPTPSIKPPPQAPTPTVIPSPGGQQGQSPTPSPIRLPQAPEEQGPSIVPPTAGPTTGLSPALSPSGGCTCVCPPSNN